MANIKDEQFMIYNVDYEYRKYLYNYDNRVNLKANRRYTGIIIVLDHYKYFVPVPDSCFELVDIPNDKDKDYLNSEYFYIRRSDVKKEIINKVEKVYRQVKWHQDSFMARFCCNFKLLESKCDDYNLKKYIIREDIIHYFATHYI